MFPSAGYQGDYIFSLGATLFQNVGNLLQVSVDALLAGIPTDSKETKDAHIDGLIRNAKGLLGDDWLKPFDLALTAILDDIKDDLSEFGANFDAGLARNLSSHLAKLAKSSKHWKSAVISTNKAAQFGSDQQNLATIKIV